MKWYWEQCKQYVNSHYLLANKITWTYLSTHWTMHLSNCNGRRRFFVNRTCRSLRRLLWITCCQRNAISYVNKSFIWFVLHWGLLCMRLKRFPQSNVGNFRCALTEPNTRRWRGQTLIVRQQRSDWSAKPIRWHLLEERFWINYSNIIRVNYCLKTSPQSEFSNDLALIIAATKGMAYGVVMMTARKRLQFQICLSDAGIEATTWSLAIMEHVTIQREREIYCITSNEQKRFKNQFCIRLIEFEACWETISIEALRKSIEKRVIYFGYSKTHLESDILE